MAKYVAKAKEIEAVQWFKMGDHPEVLLSLSVGPCIETLEGSMRVSEGDWIIKGIKGEYYPCKDEIFKKTYGEADNEEK